MAVFNITKGDKQVFPYRVTDLQNLVDYEFIWTLSTTEYGAPILTKKSTVGDEIIIDTATKDVDVNIDISDMDYDSTIEPGTYHCHLIAIYEGGVSDIPRTIDKSTVVVTHSQYYKALHEE
jgi:hypothetical protein